MPLKPLPTFRNFLQTYNTTTVRQPCLLCRHHRPPPRRLHISASYLQQSQTHYQTLDLPPTATHADIKKRFYALSKTHHPDRNPSNQAEASRKFVAINDAYAVLGHPEKRATYDADVLGPQQQRSRSGPGGASFSSSSTPAGGRAASGLSRRRSAFKGPPPSFYRSGGWGDAAGKREANASRDGRAEWERMRAEEEEAARKANEETSGNGNGNGHHRWPFAQPNDVPHFDREGHFRTHTTVEEQLRQGRRKRRRVFEDDGISVEGPGVEFRQFCLVGGVIVVGIGVPLFWISGGENNRAAGAGRRA